MLSPSLALREHTSSASGGVAEWAEGIASWLASRPRCDDNLSLRMQQASVAAAALPFAAAAETIQGNARPVLGNGAPDLVRTRPYSWSTADSAVHCYDIVAVAIV